LFCIQLGAQHSLTDPQCSPVTAVNSRLSLFCWNHPINRSGSYLQLISGHKISSDAGIAPISQRLATTGVFLNPLTG
jgi:hypothetical protein